MTEEPANREWLTWTLFALLVLTVLARLIGLEADPPHAAIESGGSFLTDEGWYSKSSQTLTRFGQWSSEHDIAWFSHNSLFTVLQRAVFGVFGISLVTARMISFLSFVVALGSSYAIARSAMPRQYALLTCLMVSVTVNSVAYSRLATVEPVGIAVSLVALAIWVRAPQSLIAGAASLLVAAATIFVKLSFVYTLLALLVLNAWEALQAARAGRKLAAGIRLALCVVVALSARGLHRWVVAWSAGDGALFEQWHVTGRIDAMTFRGVVQSEMKVWYMVTYHGGTALLIGVLAVGALVAAPRLRGLRFADVLRIPRPTLAMLVWGLGGITFFGLFWEQAPRYFHFALFPIAYGAVLMARASLGSKHWQAACLVLLALHAGAQVPGYVVWMRSRPLMSARDVARDVAGRLTVRSDADGAVLMGGLSPYVSFFHPRLRPLAFRQDDLPARLERYRPEFILTAEPTIGYLTETCSHLVEGVETLASYEIMDNYYTDAPHVLFRVLYKE